MSALQRWADGNLHQIWMDFWKDCALRTADACRKFHADSTPPTQTVAGSLRGTVKVPKKRRSAKDCGAEEP